MISVKKAISDGALISVQQKYLDKINQEVNEWIFCFQ